MTTIIIGIPKPSPDIRANLWRQFLSGELTLAKELKVVSKSHYSFNRLATILNEIVRNGKTARCFLGSPGEAMTFRRELYYFRKKERETNKQTPYDSLQFVIAKDNPCVVKIVNPPPVRIEYDDKVLEVAYDPMLDQAHKAKARITDEQNENLKRIEAEIAAAKTPLDYIRERNAETSVEPGDFFEKDHDT